MFSFSTVECSEGTKYVSNGDSVDCEACPKGFFQNMTAQLSCIRCPDKRTTRNAGAQSSDECQGKNSYLNKYYCCDKHSKLHFFFASNSI